MRRVYIRYIGWRFWTHHNSKIIFFSIFAVNGYKFYIFKMTNKSHVKSLSVRFRQPKCPAKWLGRILNCRRIVAVFTVIVLSKWPTCLLSQIYSTTMCFTVFSCYWWSIELVGLSYSFVTQEYRYYNVFFFHLNISSKIVANNGNGEFFDVS